MVGERSVSLRRWLVKAAGGIRSANADMSSVKAGEKPARRKRKVSYATYAGVGAGIGVISALVAIGGGSL